MMKIRDCFKKFKEENIIKETQIIVDTDLTYGMARMVQTLFESIDHNVVIKRIQL